jgi:hypothetical protein
MKNNPEYQNFEDLMIRLLRVPHSDIKAKMDAEKRTKAKKRKPKKPSASGRA